MNRASLAHSAALSGRLLLTLKLGEMPEHIPGWRACSRHGAAMAEHIDGGILDRLIAHHGGAMRAVRLHSARTPRQARAVSGAYRFDEVEQISGVARVLRIEVRDPLGLPALLRSLAELPMVESVTANHLSHAPFAATNQGAPGGPADGAWVRRCTRIDEALGYEGGDPAVVLGLADTGVSLEHVELAQRLRTGFDSVDLDPASVGGITLVGARLGENWETIQRLLANLNATLAILAGIVLVGVAILIVSSRRRRRRAQLWEAFHMAFEHDPVAEARSREDPAYAASAILLLELARSDEGLTPEDHVAIATYLRERWHLPEETATGPTGTPVDPAEFARILGLRYALGERVGLWERLRTLGRDHAPPHQDRLMQRAANMLGLGPEDLPGPTHPDS